MPKYSEVVQGILKEVNELRRAPQAYAAKVEAFLAQFHGVVRHRPNEVPIVTQEGTAPVIEALRVLQESTAPLRVCTWNEALSCAAQSHVADLGPKELASHAASDGRGLQARVERYGRWSGTLVEMLDFGSITATEIVCSLLVDDGMPFREHRESLLAPDLRYIGIGFGPHTSHGTMTAIIMATKFAEVQGYEHCAPIDGSVQENWAAKDWLEGAVRMNCEVESETEAGVLKKRIVKRWEMEDGSVKVTEELISS